MWRDDPERRHPACWTAGVSPAGAAASRAAALAPKTNHVLIFTERDCKRVRARDALTPAGETPAVRQAESLRSLSTATSLRSATTIFPTP